MFLHRLACQKLPHCELRHGDLWAATRIEAHSDILS